MPRVTETWRDNVERLMQRETISRVELTARIGAHSLSVVDRLLRYEYTNGETLFLRTDPAKFAAAFGIENAHELALPWEDLVRRMAFLKVAGEKKRLDMLAATCEHRAIRIGWFRFWRRAWWRYI